MNLNLNAELGSTYTNRTQQIRLISEDWIARNGYCLRCDSDRLIPTRANTRSRDFVCQTCEHGYELKSKRGVFSKSVLDGAYNAMVGTIRNGRTPTFLLLEYSTSWSILRLRAIHHSLITEQSVVPRKALSASARRAGWVGCNILLPAIAIQGQIPLVLNGVLCERSASRGAFARLENLSALSIGDRGWAATILRLTNTFAGARFSLQQMYEFESELQKVFPNNRNIRPKIRQQLQFLRDAGLLTFHGGGVYERSSSI
jgi:type II restriction enzyme